MTLVLLHSAGETPAVWDDVRNYLRGIPVLAPALPGREGVGAPTDTIEGHAGAVLNALDHAGLARATIAGHSLGGAVALWLALTQPGRVAGLGLVSCGARMRVNPAALAALPGGLADAAPLMAAANFPEGTDPALIERRRRAYESVGGETLLADLTACDRFDVLDRLWEIRCRTQALVGAADVLTSPKYMRMLADRVSAARYIEYPNAGHMLPLERPAEVAGELAVLWAASLDGRVSRMRGSSSLRSDSRSAASPPAG